MKYIKLFIIHVILSYGEYGYAQEKFAGVKLGISHHEIHDIGKENPDYLIGLHSEYKPLSGLFTLSSEIQFTPRSERILIPLGLNFRIGRKTKIRVTGGFLPVVSLRSTDRTFKIGAHLGTGVEIPTTKRLSILALCGIYFIPTYEYRISHDGSPYTSKKVIKSPYFCLGIQYQLSTGQ